MVLLWPKHFGSHRVGLPSVDTSMIAFVELIPLFRMLSVATTVAVEVLVQPVSCVMPAKVMPQKPQLKRCH